MSTLSQLTSVPVRSSQKETSVERLVHDLRNPLHVISLTLEVLRACTKEQGAQEWPRGCSRHLAIMGAQMSRIDDVLAKLSVVMHSEGASQGECTISERGTRHEWRTNIDCG